MNDTGCSHLGDALDALDITWEQWHHITAKGQDKRPRKGMNRLAENLEVRTNVCDWLQKNTPMSTPEIARAVGYNSHSTVVAAMQRLRARASQCEQSAENPSASATV